jgi:hypothetical protein
MTVLLIEVEDGVSNKSRAALTDGDETSEGVGSVFGAAAKVVPWHAMGVPIMKVVPHKSGTIMFRSVHGVAFGRCRPCAFLAGDESANKRRPTSSS